MNVVCGNMRQKSAGKAPPRVIAVVLRSYDLYQSRVVRSIRSQMDAAGYGTLCLTSNDQLSADRDPTQIQHILAGRVQVAGSILLAGLVGRGHPATELSRFARRLGNGPVISLGVTTPSLPSVGLDPKTALAELMDHMTSDPARKRFAFIRGPVDGHESRERERAFRDGLRRRGLEIDEQLFFNGEFAHTDAHLEIDRALSRGLRFDGLVSANDAMAASAVVALDRHGLSVPNDVIVSGFDDMPVAVELQPALTTIRQRLQEQAIAAAELMQTLLESDVDPDSTISITLPAELVIRDSTMPHSSLPPPDKAMAAALRATDSRAALRRLLVARLRRVSPEQAAAPYVDDVADAMLARLSGQNLEPIALLEYATTAQPSMRDEHWWRHIRRTLAHFAEHLPSTSDAAVRHTINTSLSRLDRALSAAETRHQLEKFTRRKFHEQMLLRLAACPTSNAVWSLLRRGLIALDVKRAWILLLESDSSSLHDSTIQQGKLDRVRIAFSLNEPQPIAPNTDYPLSELLPPRLTGELETGTLVLQALHDGDREVGYLLLEPPDAGLLELEAIAASLAQALRMVRQLSALSRRAIELRQANDALTRLARYDSLTGLPNRNRFTSCFNDALTNARDRNCEVALLYFDLDGFKLINDTLGHSAGDELLTLVAQRVERIIHGNAVLARLGGDEFTIIAPQHANELDADRLAGEVLEAITEPFLLGKRSITISASVGIAAYPTDGEDTETLVKNADTAMYQAKASGRNRVARFTPEMNANAVARLELSEMMHRAFELGEFCMHYQPRLNLNSGRLVGFEALMRWPQAHSTVTGPDQFIPVAEETGFIGTLDAFALDRACFQAKAWDDAGLSVPVAVNLSIHRLQQADIVDQILATLTNHHLPAHLLELEITETAAMTDVEGNIIKLRQLRDAGIAIAIDDFGTGHSSMNYLKQLPVTSLKIDRSFLEEIGGSHDQSSADTAITRAIIALAQSMEFIVVAEGIETRSQRDFLRDQGCTEGQGFLFDPALTPAEATVRLERRAELDRLALAQSDSHQSATTAHG